MNSGRVKYCHPKCWLTNSTWIKVWKWKWAVSCHECFVKYLLCSKSKDRKTGWCVFCCRHTNRRAHSHGTKTKNILDKEEPWATGMSFKFQLLKWTSGCCLLTSACLGGLVHKFGKIFCSLDTDSCCIHSFCVDDAGGGHLSAWLSEGNLRSPAGWNSQTWWNLWTWGGGAVTILNGSVLLTQSGEISKHRNKPLSLRETFQGGLGFVSGSTMRGILQGSLLQWESAFLSLPPLQKQVVCFAFHTRVVFGTVVLVTFVRHKERDLEKKALSWICLFRWAGGTEKDSMVR